MSTTTIKRVFSREEEIAANVEKRKKHLYDSLSAFEGKLREKEFQAVAQAEKEAEKAVQRAIKSAEKEVQKLQERYEGKRSDLKESFKKHKAKVAKSAMSRL